MLVPQEDGRRKAPPPDFLLLSSNWIALVKWKNSVHINGSSSYLWNVSVFESCSGSKSELAAASKDHFSAKVGMGLEGFHRAWSVHSCCSLPVWAPSPSMPSPAYQMQESLTLEHTYELHTHMLWASPPARILYVLGTLEVPIKKFDTLIPLCLDPLDVNQATLIIQESRVLGAGPSWPRAHAPSLVPTSRSICTLLFSAMVHQACIQSC
jgi:hypothetical protein